MPIIAGGCKGEVVVIDSVAFTGSAKGALVVAFAESVTFTLNVTDPAAGGVPVSTPAELMASQAGKPVADHV